MEQTRLQQEAMLMELSLKSWAGRATDKDATRKVVRDAGASPDAAKVLKRLVNVERLRPIEKVTDKIRNEHNRLTLPWNDKGVRLLPIKTHGTYCKVMDDLFAERTRAVNDFVDHYQDAVNAARQELGTLFKLEDYPHPGDIRSKWDAQYQGYAVPDGAHFIANLGQEEADRVRKQIEATVHGKVAGAVTDLYRRLGESVQEVAKRMIPEDDGKARRFRDSQLENLREMASLVSELNVTGDAALEGLCAKVHATIKDVHGDMLRPNKRDFDADARRRVEKELGELSEKFAGFFGGEIPKPEEQAA